MRRFTKWWAVALAAVAGAGVCVSMLVAFFLRILHNELPWNNGDGARELYQLVGDSWSEGFIVGFFLCFCLTVVAVALSSWVEQSRRRTRAARAPREVSALD